MLGKNIKKYRLLSGLSLKDMAAKLGVSYQTIKRYEDETMMPDSLKLIEIAKLLNVGISDLVYSYSVPTEKEYQLKMLIADEIAK